MSAERLREFVEKIEPRSIADAFTKAQILFDIDKFAKWENRDADGDSLEKTS